MVSHWPAFAPADYPSRDPCRLRPGRNIAAYGRASSHDRAASDGHSRKEHRIHADICAGKDAHRLDDKIGGDDRQACRQTCVLRAENLHSWTEPDIVLKDQVARIEKALRAYPDAIADRETAIMSPLENRLVTNEHAVAEFERLWMPKADSHADLQAYAATLHQSAQTDPAHGGIQPARRLVEPVEQPQRFRPTTLVQQFRCERHFECGIGW